VNLEEYRQEFRECYDDLDSVEVILSELKQCQHTFTEEENEVGEFIKSLEQRKKELKDEIKNSQTNNYNDWVFEYDFDKYSFHLEPVESLNTEGLSYPLFLRDVIIPSFHPLPDEDIQTPIAAICMLINSAALPPISENNSKELLLPLVYISGATGTGKSKLAGLFERHYPFHSRKQLKGSDTGATLIDRMHKACYVRGSYENNDLVLKPALFNFENFYAANLKRWGDYGVEILTTEKQYAVVSKQGKDKQDFYTYCLKIFTSIEPLQAVSKQMSEMDRRTIRLFTKRANPKLTISSYNWKYSMEQYKKLWEKNKVENIFFPILGKVSKITEDDTDIPDEYYPASQVIMAVGVYLGIFEDIDHAIEHLTEYWNYVKQCESKRGVPFIAYFDELIEEYYVHLQEYLDKGYSHKRSDNLASQELLYADEIFDKVWDTHNKFYNKTDISEAMKSHFEKKGFTYTVHPVTKKAIFRKYL